MLLKFKKHGHANINIAVCTHALHNYVTFVKTYMHALKSGSVASLYAVFVLLCLS